MHRIFALFAAAIVFSFLSSSAVAAQSREVAECEHLMSERNAAMGARDWVTMEKFANVFIKKCQRVVTPLEYSKAYWESAVAAEKLGRRAAALKYIDGCISVAYSNASCHVEKVLILMDMKRTDEARRLITPTSKLLASQLENTKRELARSMSSTEKESLAIDVESLEVGTEHIKLIASKLGMDL